ncbi:MAG: sensor domain-containing protein, partial [Nakamurella sp.]
RVGISPPRNDGLGSCRAAVDGVIVMDMATDLSSNVQFSPRIASSNGSGRAEMSPTARAIGEAVYCVLSLLPAVGIFVATVTLCAVGVGLSLVWVGVPVLALGLLVARLGGYLKLGLCDWLLGRPMLDPGPPPRRRSGPVGALSAVLGDPANWRAVCYWLLKMVLAPVQFGVTVGLYAFALGGAGYSLWRGWLPAQQAADGSWHRGAEFGGRFFIDSWPQMLLPTIAGLLVLAIAPTIVRALAAVDSGLMRYLLAGRPRR